MSTRDNDGVHYRRCVVVGIPADMSYFHNRVNSLHGYIISLRCSKGSADTILDIGRVVFVPPPQKILQFYISKWYVLVHSDALF